MTSRWLLPAMIVAAAALFAIGTTIERNQGDHHDNATRGAAHSEPAIKGETAGEHAAEPASGSGETTSTTTESGAGNAETGGESRIFGIDAESPALIALAVAVSLVLAGAVLRWPWRAWLLGLVGLAMLAFGVLDIREVAHQIDANRTGLTIVSGAVAVLHLAVATLSAGSLRRHPL